MKNCVSEGEIVDCTVNAIYNIPIGLMYVSDYVYATNPVSWSYSLSDYNLVRDSNWLYNSMSEWTITRNSADGDVFQINNNGSVSSAMIGYTGGFNNTRPVFYLNFDVKYISGTGTESDTYRIQ